MYEAFYGLTNKPFQLNPDPSFYFGSKQHKRAAAYLDYGLHQGQGFIVITGEVGAGKTTIVRNMLNKLDSNKVIAAQLVSTQLDAEDTLRLVGAAFGVRVKDVPKSDLIMTLEAYFTMAATEGKRCLLIVDEAQNLSQRAVEELRMLSNFQYENTSLVQTFLIGQPEFRAILQRPDMLQLRQRVIASCHISPMDEAETKEYVLHRLRCAGYSGKPMFDGECFEAIYVATQGVPRRINTLCDRVLLRGFLEDKKSFTRQEIEEVAQEIVSESEYPGHKPSVLKELSRVGDRIDMYTGDSDEDILEVEGVTLDAAGDMFAKMNMAMYDDRLRRLERSMLRIEKSNAAVLAVLVKLLDQTMDKNEA